MEEKIEYKQQYLRSEIIDQGYNPEDFSEFMGSIRGEENLDLEKWSFPELQNVVEQYKSKISNLIEEEKKNNEEINIENKNSGNIEQELKHDSETELIKQSTPSKEKEQKELEFPKDAFEEYEKIIKTIKLEENELTNNDNIHISISSPVKVNPGFFSSSYYQYKVHTDPLGYKVIRKLSDFSFLYQTLPLFNSSVFNPVLPNSEFGLKDDSPKKMLYLQNYLNALIESKFFRSLPIVFEFLSLSQEDWNKKRIEKYNKTKPLPIEKIPTLEGIFNICINKSNDSKAIKIKDEINKKNEAFDALNMAMDELLSMIEKISLCFKNLGKSFLDLSKIHKNNNNVLFDMFSRLSSLSKVWARSYIKQRDFLSFEFKHFFNYMNSENISFIKKFEEFKTIRDDYLNKYEKMKKAQSKNDKDLKSFEKLRIDYGLELLMVNNEYDKLLERQASRMMTRFMKYNDNKRIIMQDYNNCIKLFNINEDIKNIDLEGSVKKEGNEDEEQFSNKGSSGSIEYKLNSYL